MKPPLPLAPKLSRTVSVFLLIGAMTSPALAQAPSPAAEKKIPAEVAIVKAPATVATPDAVGDTNALAASHSAKDSQVKRLAAQPQQAVDAGLKATRLDPLRAQYWKRYP